MTETEPRVPSAESPTANMAQQETMRGGSQGKKGRPDTKKPRKRKGVVKRQKGGNKERTKRTVLKPNFHSLIH